jgi:predicted SprT family Zn-dependent metalloprotease
MDTAQELLAPLPYHIELRDYLKSSERELWQWFASAQAQADYTGNLRLDLLRSTYRLDSQAHADLYQAVEEVKSRLQLDIPVTVYQAQQSLSINAALYFIPGEGHLVFYGPVLALLEPAELRSVIGHELAHYHLWVCSNGEFHIADRLIQAVAGDPRAAASHEETARRYQLYTEIFADRGSLHVTGDPHPVISGLLKTQTGLSQASAASYLRQAEEIFASGNVASDGLSHPETFIRARALALWHEGRADTPARISAMIEGPIDLDQLDVIEQRQLTQATRRFLEYFLQPRWFQTPAVLGHAKLFFDDFQPVRAEAPELTKDLSSAGSRLREYLGYVLLDFVAADPELEETPLARALELVRELGWDSEFQKLAAKELKMKARDLLRIKEQAAQILARAEVSGG